MSEASFHTTLAYAVIGTGLVTFIALFFITAPYGRPARGGWGPPRSNRLGWVIMESPAALAFLGIYAMGRRARETTPMVLCSLWLPAPPPPPFVFSLLL